MAQVVIQNVATSFEKALKTYMRQSFIQAFRKGIVNTGRTVTGKNADM